MGGAVRCLRHSLGLSALLPTLTAAAAAKTAAPAAVAVVDGHSALLDADREVGQLLLEAYTFTEGGAAQCPRGYGTIVDINTCTAAGEALGAVDNTGVMLEELEQSDLTFVGCVIDELRQAIYYRAPPPLAKNATTMLSDSPQPLPANLGHVCKKSREVAAESDGDDEDIGSEPWVTGRESDSRRATFGVEVVMAIDGLDTAKLAEGDELSVLDGIEKAVEGALLEVVPSGIAGGDIKVTFSASSIAVKAFIDTSNCTMQGVALESFISEQANELGLLASESVSTVPGVEGQVQVSLVGITAWQRRQRPTPKRPAARPPAAVAPAAPARRPPQQRSTANAAAAAAAGDALSVKRPAATNAAAATATKGAATSGGPAAAGKRPAAAAAAEASDAPSDDPAPPAAAAAPLPLRDAPGDTLRQDSNQAKENKLKSSAVHGMEEKALLGPHLGKPRPRLRLEYVAAAGLAMLASALSVTGLAAARSQHREQGRAAAGGGRHSPRTVLPLLRRWSLRWRADPSVAELLEDRALD